MQISVVIITLNASQTLESCLQSCQQFTEIIVLDSGSTDNTINIAKQYGAKVHQHNWLGFGRQKQLAVSLASNDWVLCLDADEWLSQSLQDELKTLDNPTQANTVFALPRCNRFMGKFLRHGEGYPDWCIRLFNKKQARWSNDSVHEIVEHSGKVIKLKHKLMHESGEKISHYLEKQNRYTDLQAEILFKKGKKVSSYSAISSAVFRFIKFYLIKRGFLDGLPGLIHILIGCGNSLFKYIKLMELQRLNKEKK